MTTAGLTLLPVRSLYGQPTRTTSPRCRVRCLAGSLRHRPTLRYLHGVRMLVQQKSEIRGRLKWLEKTPKKRGAEPLLALPLRPRQVVSLSAAANGRADG